MKETEEDARSISFKKDSKRSRNELDRSTQCADLKISGICHLGLTVCLSCLGGCYMCVAVSGRV